MCVFQESYIDLYHGRIALIQIKPEKIQQTILFLHGWQDNAATFSTVMAAYAKRHPNHHLIAIDWFGHGLSSHKGEDNFYHFFDYVDDLHQIILHLHLEFVVLIGHSLGGLVASVYSAVFPEKVAALVMIEALGPLSEKEDQISNRIRQGILSRQRYRYKPKRALKDIDHAMKLRASTNGLAESLVAPMVRRSVSSVSDDLFWTTDTKIKCDSLYRMSENHALSLLSTIKCPVIAIIGDTGYEHLKQQSYRFSNIADFECYQIAGGHHCHLENPEQVSHNISILVSKL